MNLKTKKDFLIIPHKKEHNEALLKIFDQNVPIYFGRNEKIYYQRFLDKENQDNEMYFDVIYQPTGTVIGGGGFYFLDESDSANLSWGFLQPELHNSGIGTLLLRHRIKEIQKTGKVDHIICETSQKTYLFFQKQGFELVKTKKDFWAPGLDLYHMKLNLQNVILDDDFV